MKRALVVLYWLILFIFFGCDTVQKAGSSAVSNDTLVVAVNQYDGSQPGYIVSEAYIRCKKALKETLALPEAIGLSAEDILPINNHCYLETGKAVVHEDITARLLEFRVCERAEGAGSTIFVQYQRKGENVAYVQELAEAMTNCTNDEQVKTAMLAAGNDTIRADITISGHAYPDEIDYENVYTYRLVNLEWVKYPD